MIRIFEIQKTLVNCILQLHRFQGCHDPESPPLNFNRRSLFIKVINNKSLRNNVFLLLYEMFCFKIFYDFPRKAIFIPPSPLWFNVISQTFFVNNFLMNNKRRLKFGSATQKHDLNNRYDFMSRL